MKKLLLIVGMGILLAGCTTQSPSQESGSCGLTPSSGSSCSTPTESWAKIDLSDLTTASETALIALKTENLQLLSQVASSSGIRFSPYNYVDTGKNIILSTTDILTESGKIEYVRGSEDGTGDPILLPFDKYRKKYIYDEDFSNGQKTINENISRGNTINNAYDVYTGKTLIEYYIPGKDPQYQGMDRKTLTLVFTQENGEWRLLGIIHNQRTI